MQWPGMHACCLKARLQLTAWRAGRMGGAVAQGVASSGALTPSKHLALCPPHASAPPPLPACRRSPLRVARAYAQSLIMAFGTSSSAASLPLVMQVGLGLAHCGGGQ